MGLYIPPAISSDAPSNGNQYARENAAWAIVSGGGGGAGNFTLLDQWAADGIVSTFGFDIPAGYDDFELIFTGRSGVAAQFDTLLPTLNSSAGYDMQRVNYQGGAGVADQALNQPAINLLYTNGTSVDANFNTYFRLRVFDYLGTTFYKPFEAFNRFSNDFVSGNAFINFMTGQARISAAINRIDVAATTGPYLVGSTARLYGIGN